MAGQHLFDFKKGINIVSIKEDGDYVTPSTTSFNFHQLLLIDENYTTTYAHSFAQPSASHVANSTFYTTLIFVLTEDVKNARLLHAFYSPDQSASFNITLELVSCINIPV